MMVVYRMEKENRKIKAADNFFIIFSGKKLKDKTGKTKKKKCS